MCVLLLLFFFPRITQLTKATGSQFATNSFDVTFDAVLSWFVGIKIVAAQHSSLIAGAVRRCLFIVCCTCTLHRHPTPTRISSSFFDSPFHSAFTQMKALKDVAVSEIVVFGRFKTGKFSTCKSAPKSGQSLTRGSNYIACSASVFHGGGVREHQNTRELWCVRDTTPLAHSAE